MFYCFPKRHLLPLGLKAVWVCVSYIHHYNAYNLLPLLPASTRCLILRSPYNSNSSEIRVVMSNKIHMDLDENQSY